ncbi:Glycosyl hydrolases family 31 protein, partial [Prunus dulcis]
ANKNHEWLLAVADALLRAQTWNLVPHTPTMNVLSNNLVRSFVNWMFKMPFCMPVGFVDLVYPDHLGFIVFKSDSSLFIYIYGSVCIYLLIYADDILVTGSDPASITILISDLGHQFSMRDLGLAHYFWAWNLLTEYVVDLLKCANMHEAKPVPSPAVGGRRLRLSGDLLFDLTEYRSIIGAFQCLALTHPDISFAHPSSQSYSDADYVGDPTIVTPLVAIAFIWQLGVSRSSTESEYRQLALHCRHFVLVTGFVS